GDTITDSMRRAIDETNRRREIQMAYNKEHNVKPMTIKKEVVDTLKISMELDDVQMTRSQIVDNIEKLKALMTIASAQLDFESAIKYREEISKLKQKLKNN
ncbi:MAG: UvrB/UvrC motif-containing protein, partial [Clostridia bacterium]|nr:UvrB/UvrC motif-containing protein [Clostridia bacterium]